MCPDKKISLKLHTNTTYIEVSLMTGNVIGLIIFVPCLSGDPLKGFPIIDCNKFFEKTFDMEHYKINHLRELEAESIFVIREVVAQFEKPVMLFREGKIRL
jgi:hypothetical protein